MKRILGLLLLTSIVAFSGCKKEDDPVATQGIVRFTLVYDGAPVSLEEVFLTSDGYRMRLDRFDFYVSNAMFWPDDSDLSLESVYLLRFDQNVTSLEFPLDVESASRLDFSIGVPAIINENPDPSQYTTDHPLSDFSGMYWSWNSGYKFVQIEGKADLTGTEEAPLDHPISIHTGLGSNFESVSFEKSFSADCEQIVANVRIDIKEWFSSVHDIDIAVDSETHTTDNPELAEKFSDNFAASMYIE